jgi:single-stranded-DNA-specific exonuclease
MQKALAALGLSSHDEVQDFLVPPMSAWTGGAPFPSLKNSVEEIWTVVQTHQPVCIHGDFDTDGLCAMTVLRKGLEVLGIEVFGHLPRREQGHGVSIESFAEVLSLGAKSVITVDCGISANEVGELAAEKGIPFIVTDHHLPDEELPKAVAIVNPQLDPHDGNSQQLCGAGVALKLVLELAQKAPEHKSHSTEFRDYFRHAVLLSAIATIGDVMPLTGDNRALVQ